MANSANQDTAQEGLAGPGHLSVDQKLRGDLWCPGCVSESRPVLEGEPREDTSSRFHAPTRRPSTPEDRLGWAGLGMRGPGRILLFPATNRGTLRAGAWPGLSRLQDGPLRSSRGGEGLAFCVIRRGGKGRKRQAPLQPRHWLINHLN